MVRLAPILGLSVLALSAGHPASASGTEAVVDPLDRGAGIYKLGWSAGSGSAGIPYIRSDGTTGVLTAKHAVGEPSTTAWAIRDALGNVGWGTNVATSRQIDVAFLSGSTQWAQPPLVRLSEDYAARFDAVAGPADVKVGDRVCRTGWSPLSGTGLPADGSPNLIPPPELGGSAGASVICGRINFVSADGGVFTVGNSDRPDRAVVSIGDSGGAVWKRTGDGGFMYMGIIFGRSGSGIISGGGFTSWPELYATSASGIKTDPDLQMIKPMTAPQTGPFFVISTATYNPERGTSTELQGSLRAPNGTPLSSQPVEILAGPNLATAGNTTTDADGNLRFTTGPVQETTQFAFRWWGNAQYPATASRVIAVSPTTITIPTPPAAVTTGTPFTIAARATTAAGTPIVGREVRLQIYQSGSAAYAIAATATTNSHGEVELTGQAAAGSSGYAVRLSSDPLSNGNPVGAAASAIYPIGPGGEPQAP